ncbi:MAG: N-6 DNA methylase [Chloroflexi bacterium]|nr:N-6 DNA methylase [Chloroflexota bacterium]
MALKNFQDKVNFIFSIADALRGPYKPNQYGKVILPLTILRRMDCVLEPTKQKVLEAYEKHKDKSDAARESILNRIAKQQFHNTSKLDFAALKGDANHIARNISHYIKSFSPRARDIFEKFGFAEHIEKLDSANRLYLIVSKFAEVDLHPDTVSNQEMGYIFEELIRKYNEDANETAGDHFTPREVIRLMVNIIFAPDSHVLTKKGIAPTIYDPTCGTGGMISTAEEYVAELNPDARPEIFGQDYNPESYAICGSDMLIKGHSIEHIVFGDVLGDGKTFDGFPSEKFDYMLANPPFGVKWEAEKDYVTKEHENQGFSGRFGAGLPRINDGSFLFLLHMISKMKSPKDGGTRLGIVFNGSPLFTGDAGQGESNIRRWIIENDWLDTIIALPDQLFYNTGIYTYIWIVTNRKEPHRRGKIQLIDATQFFVKMKKSLGNKRNEVGYGQDGKPDHIAELTRIYGEFKNNDKRTVRSNGDTKTVVASKIFDNTDFGCRKITVERPLRLKFQITKEGLEALQAATPFQNLAVSKKKDKKACAAEEEAGRKQQAEIISLLESMGSSKVWMDRKEFLADLDDAIEKKDIKLPAPIKKAIIGAFSQRDENAAICLDKDGNPEPDPELRDYEYVPLKQDIYEYFDREVKPFASDAWIDETKRDEKDGKVGIVGYEVPFNRHFYVYQPPRPLEDIEADMVKLEKDIIAGIQSVVVSHRKITPVMESPTINSPRRTTVKYPEYKPSGFHWLGDIPAHWKMRKLKFISNIRNSNVDKKSDEDERVVKLCNYVDVYYNDYITTNLEFMVATASLDEIIRFRLKHGDVLITKDSEEWDDIAVPAFVDEPLDDIICGYHLALIQPDEKQITGEYLFRAFSAHAIRDQFRVRANGITRFGLSRDGITSALFPVPPLNEQHAIAQFLRRECNKINNLIAGISKDTNGQGLFSMLVKTLLEYRSSLISAAVTGKIDVSREASE